MTLEELRVWAWITLNYPKYKYQCWKTRADKQALSILTSAKSVDLIVSKRLSVCRFGDGELQMVSHLLAGGNRENFDVDTFQGYDPKLASRLKDILFDQANSLTFPDRTSGSALVCLPYQLKDSSISKIEAQMFWDREWLSRKDILVNHCRGFHFGDTNFTRFYLSRVDILDYPAYITSMRRIWDKRPVIMIEGKYSRLGIGNDLFDNAESIRRVLCPATNAFSVYEKIRETISKLQDRGAIPPDALYLVALGHTATVLAYDLSKDGQQAIDIGHIDVEYEWYRIKATKKVPVPNKYVNEVKAGRIDGSEFRDEALERQVIAHITLDK